MEKVQLQVEGMTCMMCSMKIKAAVKKAGAKAVPNVKAKTVEVDFDSSQVRLEDIKAAITSKGYAVI